MANFYGQFIGFGAGVSGVAALAYQGSSSGYSLGDSAGAGANNTRIDKYSMVGTGNATTVGSLTEGRGSGASASSLTHGYYCSGYATSGVTVTIDKFQFSNESISADVGNSTAANYAITGFIGPDFGYRAGGAGESAMIERYSFASGTQHAATVAVMSSGAQSPNGNNSLLAGYITGGTASGRTNIEKIVFASIATTVNVAALSLGRRSASTSSSADHGYCSGGYSGSVSDVIDRFDFASDGDATSIGSLDTGRAYLAHQTSGTNAGFVHGGGTSGAASTNVIKTHLYASSADSTDVGVLTQAVANIGGCNV